MTMRPTRAMTLLAAAAIVLAAASASAQPTPARAVARPPAASAAARVLVPPAAEELVQLDAPFVRIPGTVVRIAQNYTVRPAETVDDVVTIFGAPTIQGHVEGNLVVIAGAADLGATAVVDGNVVIVAGTVNVAPGAAVHGDFVVIGGASEPAEGFTPGGEHVVIGLIDGGPVIRQFVPWLTHGLLWGRLIVPSLPWVWAFFGVVFVVSLGLAVLFDRPIRACADAVSGRPMSVFLTGLAVLLLSAPVLVILTASVIGLAVVPFAICALIIGWIFGKVGVVRWMGRKVLPESDPDSRGQAVRSFVLGFAVLAVAYMIPLLGLLTWAMVSVFGLGAATLTFLAAVRRENPAPEPKPVPHPMAAPAPAEVPPAAGVPFVASPLPATAADGPAEFAGTPVGTAAPSAAASAGVLALPHAGFAERLAAFVLDVILVFLIAGLLDLNDRHTGVTFLLLLVYHVAFWTWKGTTIGGIICQLQVVRTDGRPVEVGDAIVRGLASVFSLAVVGLGGLWILKDPERQAWHDKIAGTYVVKVPKHWRLL